MICRVDNLLSSKGFEVCTEKEMFVSVRLRRKAYSCEVRRHSQSFAINGTIAGRYDTQIVLACRGCWMHPLFTSFWLMSFLFVKWCFSFPAFNYDQLIVRGFKEGEPFVFFYLTCKSSRSK